jgi:DNA helicase-2/ATP-dependent DNA helicase PcrA
MKFTKAQNDAITYDCKNIQIIACAGSGKTEVVANRVVHLLSTEVGLKPRNIIAFTYNDKAAAELKDRIITRCHEKYGDMTGLAEMFIGSIHAFCLDLIKTEIPKYMKFDVLDEVQQSLFIDRLSKQSGLTASTDLSGNKLKRYTDTSHYIEALTILREAEINWDILEGNTVVNGLESYRTLLDQKSYLDFSQQLYVALEILAFDDDVKSRLAERVRYLIVDEYQDVNPIQEAIIFALHDLGAKLCVVGDDDQTIYQWRGSDIRNILNFRKRYPEVKYIALGENFRSSPGIVETAHPFIKKNIDRLPKSMVAAGIQQYEPGDIVALPFSTPDQEAQYIANTIQSLRGTAFLEEKDGELVERGLAWSDMAILLRSVKGNGDPILNALDAAGIRFVVIGMNDNEW